MAKIVLKVSMESELRDKIAKASKEKYLSVSAWLTGAAVDALPKQPTAKPLSVAEQKAEAYAARKAKKQAEWRVKLANGWTVQGILTSCQSWRKEAAQWLGEITRVLPTDMPLFGATETEQATILAARKAELEASMSKTPPLVWDEGETNDEGE